MKKILKSVLKWGVALAALALMLRRMNRLIFSRFAGDEELGDEEGQFFDWRFGKIYYRVRGKGSPLILLHDMDPVASCSEWSRIEDELAKDHCLYIMDLPGHGRSDKKRLIYTAYFYVKALNDFAEKELGRCCDILASGASSGIALMAVRERPELYGRLVFSEPELPKNEEAGSFMRRIPPQLLMLPILGTSLYAFMNRRSLIREKLKTEYLGGTEPGGSEMNRALRAVFAGGAGARFPLASRMSGYLWADYSGAVRGLEKPLLLITADRRERLSGNAQAIERQCQEARLCLTEGSGRAHITAPAETACAVSDFLLPSAEPYL